MVLGPGQIKQAIYSSNELKIILQEAEAKNMALESQVKDLKSEIKSHLEKEAPNIEELTEKLAKD